MLKRSQASLDSLLLCIVGILFCALALLWSAQARADVPTISTGPSVSFFRFGFKLNDPTNAKSGDKAGVDVLAVGAGWSLHYNPTVFQSADHQIAYASLTGTVLGQFDTLPISGGLAVAAGPSFYNGLVGLQVGYSLFNLSANLPMEGLFAGGAGGRRNVFVLCNVSINLLLQGSNPLIHTAAKGALSPQATPPNYWRLP